MSTYYKYHVRFLLEWLYYARVYHYFTSINVRHTGIASGNERYRTKEKWWWRSSVRGWRMENDAGVKESRVSRVTIRFGTAVVSAGSWALSICNSLYGVRDVCMWLYCIGHGNATRTISNYTVVDGKRIAGAGESPELSKRWRVLYARSSLPRRSLCRGALKIQASRPAVIRWRMIFRRGEWNFHLT